MADHVENQAASLIGDYWIRRLICCRPHSVRRLTWWQTVLNQAINITAYRVESDFIRLTFTSVTPLLGTWALLFRPVARSHKTCARRLMIFKNMVLTTASECWETGRRGSWDAWNAGRSSPTRMKLMFRRRTRFSFQIGCDLSCLFR